MLHALAVGLPLVLAGVFVASAVAKFRRPDDLSGWAELGVPKALRQRWLVTLHPWGELVLGLALILLGGVLGFLAAVVAFFLMAAYLVLVVRARQKTPDASCACFGERRRITRVTIARNAWLTALAAVTASVIVTTPLWGGAVAAIGADAGWIVGLAVAAVTSALILWPEGADDAEPAAQPAAAPASSDDEADYIRRRTPAVTVTLADGTTTTLRDLTRARPMLMLAVSEWCGSCEPVIESIDEWRALLPELDVRFLVTARPEDSRLTSTVEPQTMHDPQGHVRASIEDWPTPSAVLFGADGMLAGGPESGVDGVRAFVHDIRASLDEILAEAQSAAEAEQPSAQVDAG